MSLLNKESLNDHTLTLVRVIGLEPAHLTALEPNDSATSSEPMFSYLTNAIVARISVVVK